jgi:hypothetical protein
MTTITYDDLLKTYREFTAKFPKQEFIKSVYITNPNSYLVPRESFYKVEYEGDKYWFIHYLDFQKLKKQFEESQYKDESMFIRTGALGDLMGIPVFQDEDFIRKVLIEKFSPKTNPFTDVFRTTNIS